ncbi:helical backbone metal receptor [Ilumatobacter nonamiensis]|uniref:helical backbone metal receptor n=1 Tax=Ilumatobacter nonamiensis TaxID=467093 RepID=UPI000591627C|nr:helical backbone metal receptor [Ilumatobacter nonamiensis]
MNDPSAGTPRTRHRVVSLVPSSTETLLALGADVVACSRFCEQPDLTHVGGTKNPDIPAILDLAPDLVVLDSEENRIEDHDEMVSAGLDVFVSDVVDLTTALEVVGRLATASGVPSPSTVDAMPEVAADVARRTAFVPIWRRPWMTISSATYGGSLLAHLGIDLIATAGDGAYPTVDLADVAAEHPDLVIVPSEPYDFGAPHLAELADEIAGAHVVEIDGQDLFWWGIRTPHAVNRLAAALALPPTE